MSIVEAKGIIKFEAVGVASYAQMLNIDGISFALIDDLNLECSFKAEVSAADHYQDQYITNTLEHICASIIIATGLDIVSCEIREVRNVEDNSRTMHQTGNARIVQYGLDPSDIPAHSDIANKICNTSSSRLWSVASLIYSAETTDDEYGKFWLLYSALQILSTRQFTGNDRQRVNQLMLKYLNSTEPSHLQTLISDYQREAGDHISIVTATRDAFSHDNATFNNGQQYDLRYGLVIPSLSKMLEVCKEEIKIEAAI